MAENATEKTKSEERIERLQQINTSMQQMFVEKMEKANIEHESHVQMLKIQIAQLNTEIAKSKVVGLPGMSKQPVTAAATAAAADDGGVEDFDDDKEIAKVTGQKFEQKVKELLKVQTELEVN